MPPLTITDAGDNTRDASWLSSPLAGIVAHIEIIALPYRARLEGGQIALQRLSDLIEAVRSSRLAN